MARHQQAQLVSSLQQALSQELVLGTSQLLELPKEVLARIIEALSVSDRLKGCALACKQLHQVSVTVTDSLVRQGQEGTQEGFERYLYKYGHHLTSIKLVAWEPAEGFSDYPLHITDPCPNLQDLELQKGCACLHSMLQQHTGLTCLVLHDVGTEDAPEQLSTALAVCPGLRELSVTLSSTDLPWTSAANVPDMFVHEPPPQLTKLSLALPDLTDDSLQHLSCLTTLQDLHIDSTQVTAAAVQDVTTLQQLQRLHLCTDQLPCDPSTAAFFESLTSLQFLQLEWCDLDPVVLATLTQLTGLDLRNTCMQEDVEVVVSPAAAYTALTASSGLQSLMIQNCHMPAGIWEHVFPSTRKHAQLRALGIWGRTLSPAEFSAVVNCCARITQLTVDISKPPAQFDGAVTQLLPQPLLSQFTALRQLQVLQELTVVANNDMALYELSAALTGLSKLSSLHITGSVPALRIADVAALAGLKQLRCLQLIRYRPTPDTADEHGGVVLETLTLRSKVRCIGWLEYVLQFAACCYDCCSISR